MQPGWARARFLGPIEFPAEFNELTERVGEMVSLSLNALVNLDPKTAQKVRETDDEVDRINADMYTYM